MSDILLPLIPKKRLLVVDDEEVNRELLVAYLDEEYDIEMAVDGIDALEKLAINPGRFSAILLDILMPRKDGLSVLKELQQREDAKDIPVVVLTSERSLEVEALRLGALDFIKKPYESPEVVKARVWRIVEWRENSKLVHRTLRDSMTHLYTKEYFRYFVGEILDQGNEMDILAIFIPKIDVAHEFFPAQLVDSTMVCFAELLREFGRDYGGISMYDHEGLFYLCLPRKAEIETLLSQLQGQLDQAFAGAGLEVKLGRYPVLEKDVDLACNRAYRAAKSVANDVKAIGYYDERAHELALRKQRLLADFGPCLERGDFRVYFQPKYAIQGQRYALAGGESLIRWFHKELGFISPGEFIPLLEESGRVFELDRFVYRESLRVLEKLNKNGYRGLALSANASRAEILDSSFIPYVQSLLEHFDLGTNVFHLEVTESAFVDSIGNLVDTVKQIRDNGIQIELDDFGSGYSSLGMLTSLPFDYLKIDMAFVRRMFLSTQDEMVLKAIIEMAGLLGKKTIAEGAEEQRQVEALKRLGCDYVQGYYFSKALPEEEFFALVAKEFDHA